MMGFSYPQLYQALQDWPVKYSTLYLANLNRMIYLAELRVIRDLELDLFDVHDQVTIAANATSVPKPSQAQTITFTAQIAKGATSATLSSAWGGTTGPYVATFTDNEIQAVTLTATATTATWTLPMAAAAGNTAVLAPLMVVERNLWSVYSGATKLIVKRSYDFLQNYLAATAGRPLYYCDDGPNQWLIAPATDANTTAIKRRYVQRPVSIIIAQNTWIGDNLGDLLFTAALMESEQFVKSDDRYADMRTKYYQELIPQALLEIQSLVRSGKYSPLQPVAGLPGPPPPQAAPAAGQ